VVPTNLAEDFKDLDGEFAGGGEDEGPETIVLGPLRAVKLFEDGNQESEGLSAARLGGSEDVVALEGEGNGLSLDVGQNLEVRGLEA
jgi:hypothetical protein